MEMRGLDDLPIYFPGGGHEWVEIADDSSKGNGVLIMNCANCDSILSLSFHPGKRSIFGKKEPGGWICNIQRSSNCCDEPQ